MLVLAGQIRKIPFTHRTYFIYEPYKLLKWIKTIRKIMFYSGYFADKNNDIICINMNYLYILYHLKAILSFPPYRFESFVDSIPWDIHLLSNMCIPIMESNKENVVTYNLLDIFLVYNLLLYFSYLYLIIMLFIIRRFLNLNKGGVGKNVCLTEPTIITAILAISGKIIF